MDDQRADAGQCGWGYTSGVWPSCKLNKLEPVVGENCPVSLRPASAQRVGVHGPAPRIVRLASLAADQAHGPVGQSQLLRVRESERRARGQTLIASNGDYEYWWLRVTVITSIGGYE